MTPAIHAHELLRWIADETTRYEIWFANRPAAIWSVPIGPEAGSGTIRDLLLHMYTVDLRYAERLLGREPTDHAVIAAAAADAPGLFALAHRGQGLLGEAVARVDADWDATVTSVTRSAGTFVSSRRKILFHTLTHHLRHAGQLALILRQQGHPTDWMHDLILSDALA